MQPLTRDLLTVVLQSSKRNQRLAGLRSRNTDPCCHEIPENASENKNKDISKFTGFSSARTRTHVHLAECSAFIVGTTCYGSGRTLPGVRDAIKAASGT